LREIQEIQSPRLPGGKVSEVKKAYFYLVDFNVAAKLRGDELSRTFGGQYQNIGPEGCNLNFIVCWDCWLILRFSVIYRTHHYDCAQYCK